MSDSSNNEEKITIEQYNKTVISEFDKRVEQWKVEIKSMMGRLKDEPDRLPDLQAELLSNRHIVTDELSMVNRRIAKAAKRLRLMRRDKYVFYSTGVMPDGSRPNGKVAARDIMVSALKTTKGEKDLVIAGDLTEYEYTMEILENHQSFLRDCLKTIDHALYAVKNRIDLLNIFLGIK